MKKIKEAAKWWLANKNIRKQQTIISIIATQIENGTFEQYNKAKIIDKISGTRFDLKM